MSMDPYESRGSRFHRLAETTRREFLLIMGGIAAAAAAIFGGFESLKFLFPNSTLEDPPAFKVSTDPSSIAVGQVLQISSKRVAIVRDNGGFYAVYLVCTHLGCTPNYVSDVVSGSGVAPATADARGERGAAQQIPNGWACPCHGSRYFIDSTNFYGPAPRPMDWVNVSWTPDNRLFVDRSALVVYRQPGDTTPPGWRLPDTPGAKSNGLTIGVG